MTNTVLHWGLGYSFTEVWLANTCATVLLEFGWQTLGLQFYWSFVNKHLGQVLLDLVYKHLGYSFTGVYLPNTWVKYNWDMVTVL